jgi:hypothetical protein
MPRIVSASGQIPAGNNSVPSEVKRPVPDDRNQPLTCVEMAGFEPATPWPPGMHNRNHDLHGPAFTELRPSWLEQARAVPRAPLHCSIAGHVGPAGVPCQIARASWSNVALTRRYVGALSVVTSAGLTAVEPRAWSKNWRARLRSPAVSSANRPLAVPSGAQIRQGWPPRAEHMTRRLAFLL